MQDSLPVPPPGGVVRTVGHVGVSDAWSSLPGDTGALAVWMLVVGVWVLLVAAALLLLRAVCLESLDPEQDQGDDEVSGHAPSE